MIESHSLYTYEYDRLVELLGKRWSYRESGRQTEVISAPTQATYLHECLSALGVQTILVEWQYVDRDYLEDFAGYYVRCFGAYRHTCTRVHFLGMPVEQVDLDRLLRGEEGGLTAEQLQESYRGFIVVKPLPNTTIGRTCLLFDTSKDDTDLRLLHEQEVNLFGFTLRYKTLAFQEQDSEVAACATSALWSAFQFTGRTFQHRIPTPMEITRLATEGTPSNTRFFPNKGLEPTSIAQAIRAVGLEPLAEQAVNPQLLKATLYAYLRGRIPVFMSMALLDHTHEPEVPYKVRGQHGVMVAGYRLGGPAPSPRRTSDLLLEADRLTEIYVHDDQVGPFCKVVLDQKPVRTRVEITFDLDTEEQQDQQEEEGLRTGDMHWSVLTAWPRESGTHQDFYEGEAYKRALPRLLIALLHHKIRIPYATIESVIEEFDSLLSEPLPEELGIPALPKLVWDIHLTQSNSLKASIIQERRLMGEARHEFLVKNLPRFVWRAMARKEREPVFDFLFDTTDIQQGSLLVHTLTYDQDFAAQVGKRVALLPRDNAKYSQARRLFAALVYKA